MNKRAAKRLEPLLTCAFSESLVAASLCFMPFHPLPNLRQIAIKKLPVDASKHWSDNPKDRLEYWSKFPKLESLIYRPHFGVGEGDYFNIDTSFFSSPNCHLRELTLRKCRLDDLKTLKNFTHLDFKQCISPCDSLLVEMLERNRSLTRLSLPAFCRSDLMVSIGKFCNELAVLDATDCLNGSYEKMLEFVKVRLKSTEKPRHIIILAPRKQKLLKEETDWCLKHDSVSVVFDPNEIAQSVPVVPIIDSWLRNEMDFVKEERVWWTSHLLHSKLKSILV